MIRPLLSRDPRRTNLSLPLPLLALPLLALLGAAPLAAADRRIEQVLFDPDGIVTVRGQTAVQTMIEFAPDERIENIALGDSAAWQVTPNKRGNLLFLKPLAARAHTNMTVVTDQRRYLFELVSAGPRARPVYVLRFAFPEQLVLALDAASRPAAAAEPVSAAQPAAVAPPPPAPPRHTAWRASGASQLIPAEISDDGQSTYLAWSPARDLPAILATGVDGQDGPVNFTVREGTIVIDGVAPRYVLRIGKASATLVRLPASAGRPATAGEGTRR